MFDTTYRPRLKFVPRVTVVGLLTIPQPLQKKRVNPKLPRLSAVLNAPYLLNPVLDVFNWMKTAFIFLQWDFLWWGPPLTQQSQSLKGYRRSMVPPVSRVTAINTRLLGCSFLPFINQSNSEKTKEIFMCFN